jgi:Tfp pilus assembly protein PilZ
MGREQRRHQRIVVNAFVRFYEDPNDEAAQEFLQGVVKNYSNGGMFISTEHLLPKGTLVTVELPLETEDEKLAIVLVRGVVRWIQYLPEVQGIGIEFFELKEAEKQDFNEWMSNLTI